MLTGRERTGVIVAGLMLMGSAHTVQAAGRKKNLSADTGEPGDAMIQAYLGAEAERLSEKFLEGVDSAEAWRARRPGYVKEYFYMLGLDPPPERTEPHATVTRTLVYDDFEVDLLHFQSRPRLYVTANLYRPRSAAGGTRRPAVLYVCGHSKMGRNGNKTAYQSFGIWFARHGYVCLVLDSLQLGEIAAIHHGTYQEQRWWWHSRGYTPAGVECWNGVRAIDYLVGRADVDPARIAVTGASGGGAATFWIAAADERAAIAIPTMGMADLPTYVGDRVINGHCDCMFLYNTFGWPWTRIAGLIAPRPMQFVNSDQDNIFPMDANERIINRLERLYSLFGAGDRVEAVVSVGGHAYRKDIRQALYRFVNTHFKNDPRVVADSEVDLAEEQGGGAWRSLIPMESLRVFPTDADIPADQLNTTIDEHFVPTARPAVPSAETFGALTFDLLKELRRVTFTNFPQRIPAARPAGEATPYEQELTSEEGIRFFVRRAAASQPADAERVLVIVNDSKQLGGDDLGWLGAVMKPEDDVQFCDPRGVGRTAWTRKNPPNYVERAHALLGRTADTGRVWDVAAAARYLKGSVAGGLPIHVVGKGGAGLLGAYAALWEPDVAEVILIDPPLTHMDPDAPQFLNIMRVCDVPDVLGMLAPRRLTILGATGDDAAIERIRAYYAAAGAPEAFTYKTATTSTVSE